ncbi:hypothetical protein IFM89_005287 [Coptis chinensis]|uniref:Uncharacterized protein n=1 Tax=Coptis chinensis TaxID=261450 RepID=A0A835IRI6_9MAGN|nr:hypothetical protein IFM89_005287 [Coptis chinensis]
MGRRRMLALDIEDLEEELQVQPKKKTSLVSKNQTKLIKPTTTNSTKLSKKTSTNTTTTSTLPKTTFKKLNATSRSSNSTKLNTITTTKKSIDLPKNKTKVIITQTEKKPKSQNNQEAIKITEKKPKQQPKVQKTTKPNWMEIEDDDDLVSEFRDLPSKFQQTLLPDLERISLTSRAYINQANKEISEGFRPLVGKQYAPTIASIVSCVFMFLPLLLVSLIFNRIKAYFSLQKILIFVQVYLSIYFSILSFASIVTGLEPLKFFYASSQSSYICLQAFQTLAYVFYLLMLLMYMVLVFSTETGLGLKVLGLGQTFVGFAVGLHYYVTVFHRAVLHQPPRTNWKIHGIYATCFLVICLLANAERRKKAYLEDGGEEGKKS